ncbi:GNAT family N-acetyltransferase [Paeniglutamicibacter cryotolerans]|uniref:GNAT superfamily N-acetyltransferase n=1 Tax=Paeniglutamicibacter cryotolerans TaxID=670079 RepID=A0A839QDF8_9MICC|nr:GNAT family N-acetyltransferase [Paeniglutamicibacter cryotolerans]MBB2994218.1 GNAT superfamily N-acetyltransferase [Paeniglutamicibacter cryotolerans]
MPHVTTTHLQLLSRDEFVPCERPLPAAAEIARVEAITPEFSKFLYRSVGSSWQWADRLTLTRSAWDAALRAPGSETHVLYAGGAPAGYIELGAVATPAGTEVEIVYFGLFPEAAGHGLGGPLLSEGIARAWDIDARHAGFGPVTRVWLHTCSLDSPSAIGVYEKRGLTVFHTESEDIEPGDALAGLWPRA